MILVVLHLAAPFLPFDPSIAMGFPAIIVLALGFPLMTRSFKAATVLFLILGSALLAWGRQPAAEWLRASSSMSNIVVIVVVMQTFSVPIRLGSYDEAIRAWIERRFSGRRSLFLFVTATTNLLTSFLNLGSVPILVSLFEGALRRRIEDYERYFAAALSRGYLLTVLWSPGAVNLYLVARATGLSWSSVFVPGLLLALMGIALSFLLEMRRNGILGAAHALDPSVPAEAGGKESSQDASPKRGKGRLDRGDARVAHIPVVALAFVLAIYALELMGAGSSGGRILLAGAFVSTVWTLALSQRPGLAALLASYWQEGIMKAAEIGPFFVALGAFSGGLKGSGLLDYVSPALRTATNALGPASVLLVSTLIVTLSQIGLHPFITIVLFGTMLAEAGLPIPRLTVALSLSVGGAAAYMVSPFAGVIMTISKLIGAKPSDVAFRWNWRFSALFLAMGTLFAFAWGARFG